MENLKIKVNSEAESKEAQELFFELGYHWAYRNIGKNIYYEKKDIYLYAYKRGNLVAGTKENQVHFNSWCGTLVSLPELRDLVVLKRNDESDASRVNESTTEYYRVINGIWYVLLGEWEPSTRSESWIMNNTKPIKEEAMKEYLRKNSDGTYSYTGTAQPDHVSNFMIEIPEGAEIYIDLGFRNHSFYKDNFKLCWCGVRWENTVHNSVNLEHWNNTPVLWKRANHPEELPFIDDEPKYTDAEVKYMDENGQGRLQSLNDQYAEIEKVRQTLNQRQEQYGSFEDVAMTTEQMVDVMRKGYYENLAYNQKMALYMICSKMARIVNGNPNHKDSWHDIAGYATLIDNELVSEKDMPF